MEEARTAIYQAEQALGVARARLEYEKKFIDFIKGLKKHEAQRLIENFVQIRGIMLGAYASVDVVIPERRVGLLDQGDEEMTGGQVEQLVRAWKEKMRDLNLSRVCAFDWNWLKTLASGGLSDVMLRRKKVRLSIDYDESLSDRFHVSQCERQPPHISHLEPIWAYRSEGEGVEEVDAELVTFPRYLDTRADVIAELAKFGLKPATVDHLIAFAWKFFPVHTWRMGGILIYGHGSVGEVAKGSASPILFAPDGGERKLWKLSHAHHKKGREACGWAEHGGPAWNQWLLAIRE